MDISLGGMADVVIGLVFMFALLSLLTTQLNETIASLLSLRAKDLRASLISILGDEQTMERFYDNGLIKGLMAAAHNERQKLFQPQKDAVASAQKALDASTDKTDKPDKVKAVDSARETLRRALEPHLPKRGWLAWLAQGVVSLAEPATKAFPKASDAGTNQDSSQGPIGTDIKATASSVVKIPPAVPVAEEHSSYIDSETFASTILAIVGARPDAPSQTFQNLEAGIKQLPDPLQEVVTSAFVATKDDIQAAKLFIANWYDSAMDRVGGLYKRRSKNIAFCLGFFVAVVFNVNAISAGELLWKDQELRAAIAASADKYVGVPNVGTCADKDLQCDLHTLGADADLVRPLPIGWHYTVAQYGGFICDNFLSATFASKVFVTVLGWLCTGFAVSLGAPFWFDILSKFVNVRAAGKKPPKAADKNTSSS